MTFVEYLLAKEKEPYKSPPPKPSKKEIEHQKRHEYIMSGSFGRDIINTLKQELLDDIESAHLLDTPVNRHKSTRCIFQEKEYRRKNHSSVANTITMKISLPSRKNENRLIWIIISFIVSLI